MIAFEVIVGASFVLVTVILKISNVEAPALSVAVSLIEIVPTSPLVGVPLNVRVPLLKDSQEGRLEPSESVGV